MQIQNSHLIQCNLFNMPCFLWCYVSSCNDNARTYCHTQLNTLYYHVC